MIAERYELTTLLTSNLDFREWGEPFLGNKMIGAATLDRLRHGAYKIILDGESYRAPKPGTEKNQTAKVQTEEKSSNLNSCSNPPFHCPKAAPLRRKRLAPLGRTVEPAYPRQYQGRQTVTFCTFCAPPPTGT